MVPLRLAFASVGCLMLVACSLETSGLRGRGGADGAGGDGGRTRDAGDDAEPGDDGGPGEDAAPRDDAGPRPDACLPRCRQGVPACGDDGCGGSCGSCAGSDRCIDGLCNDCGETGEACCGADPPCGAIDLGCISDLCVPTCGGESMACCTGPIPCRGELQCSMGVCDE